MGKQGKRVKSKAITPIADWSKADQMIRKIGSIQRMIQKTELKHKKRAEKVKGEMVKEVKPLQEKIGVLQRSLEAFALSRKKDFKKQRSRKLNFGDIGWRKSTITKIGKNTLELIKKVFGPKAKNYITTTEKVDKDAVAKLSKESLKKIEAERVPKEVFFIEPTSPKTVDYK